MTDVIQDDRRTNWFWIDNEVIDRFGPQIGANAIAVYAALGRSKCVSQQRTGSTRSPFVVRLLFKVTYFC